MSYDDKPAVVHYDHGPDHHDHASAPSRRGSHLRPPSHEKLPYAVAEHEVKEEEIAEGEDIIAAHDEFTYVREEEGG